MFFPLYNVSGLSYIGVLLNTDILKFPHIVFFHIEVALVKEGSTKIIHGGTVLTPHGQNPKLRIVGKQFPFTQTVLDSYFSRIM